MTARTRWWVLGKRSEVRAPHPLTRGSLVLVLLALAGGPARAQDLPQLEEGCGNGTPCVPQKAPEAPAPQPTPPPAADADAEEAPPTSPALGAAGAAGAVLAVAALTAVPALAVSAALAVPAVGLDLVHAQNGNPLAGMATAFFLVPAQVAVFGAAAAVSLLVAPWGAWVANRLLGGRRMALLPAMALAALPPLVVLAATVLLWPLSLLAIRGMAQGSGLLYASWLEEGSGKSPTDAEWAATTQAVPVVFFAGVAAAEVLFLLTLAAGHGAGAAVMGWQALRSGRDAGPEDPLVEPDLLEVPERR